VEIEAVFVRRNLELPGANHKSPLEESQTMTECFTRTIAIIKNGGFMGEGKGRGVTSKNAYRTRSQKQAKSGHRRRENIRPGTKGKGGYRQRDKTIRADGLRCKNRMAKIRVPASNPSEKGGVEGTGLWIQPGHCWEADGGKVRGEYA